MSLVLTVATRRSALALAQARAWLRTLTEARPEVTVEELHVTTTGDKIQDRALSQIGGKGLFIKEIEEALLDGRARLAVHSMKDLPAELAPGLTVACVPVREDPRDALVTRSGGPLTELPEGARVGTSSLRRQVQLARARPDLRFSPLRGNVDTRLRKCEAGEVDAIVLAAAGLHRLGLAERISEYLSAEQVLPAGGQGALAIEVSEADEELRALLAPLQHVETSRRVAAERGVLRAVEGSCQVPVAAFAERVGDALRLRGLLAEPDGSRLRQRELVAPWPASDEAADALGVKLGEELRAG
ncbi:MAG: hydroxymethylbilane synthase [Polyangiaceae bacterium]|nr:hydroxymethylbilane synthase [Polyangiaceae bacterium]MCW5789192.1 hydroxymethylbilane synthase [Polyangiaceae bacterium]